MYAIRSYYESVGGIGERSVDQAAEGLEGGIVVVLGQIPLLIIQIEQIHTALIPIEESDIALPSPVLIIDLSDEGTEWGDTRAGADSYNFV